MRTLAIVAALSIASLLQRPPPGEPANRSHHLEDLTWVDAGAVMTPETVVVLPLGAASAPHGPHLPLRTDAILARHLADRVADATPVLVAPALTYTQSPALVEYAGTTTISVPTSRAA